ncbi:DUF7345 domain-containing protein [Halanaeroarchaeum sulfurireducens]|uniref:DUF7345 domain-containing protein n=1 Tax=Halanaeroarchaeum sulfurireducens TaxID=1604004 RepID=UPI0006C91B66|nr:PGF-CTERM sorting domain-containing protein [Halanaeroarchaeum sulfurireducens]
MSERPSQPTRLHRLGSVALATTLIASLLVAGVGSASAQSQQDSPAVVVDVAESGDTAITVVMAYDLTDERDRDAFETLQNDEEALADLESRFTDRMDRIATATTNRVDREVIASDVTVDLAIVDDTGVVRLSVTLENLAAVEDGQIVITEPFASGFATDRPVVVTYPAEYEVENVTPAPDETDETLTWESNTSFDGFELVLASSSDATGTQTPGFGPIAALVAVAGAAFVVWRRRD